MGGVGLSAKDAEGLSSVAKPGCEGTGFAMGVAGVWVPTSTGAGTVWTGADLAATGTGVAAFAFSEGVAVDGVTSDFA